MYGIELLMSMGRRETARITWRQVIAHDYAVPSCLHNRKKSLGTETLAPRYPHLEVFKRRSFPKDFKILQLCGLPKS